MHNLCFQIKSHLTAHDGALEREVEFPHVLNNGNSLPLFLKVKSKNIIPIIFAWKCLLVNLRLSQLKPYGFLF